MCGIAGFLDPRGTTDRAALEATAGAMAHAIAHRGPDDEGTWVDADAGVALGHRRLSIVDLSPEGHQPMASASGRYVIVFNGEIYNYEAIRAELDAAARRRASAATPTPRCCSPRSSAGALHGALERFNGMFAFALWDRQARTLHLARDRIGREAALLRPGRRPLRVRLGAEGAARASLASTPGRPRRARALPALRLRAGAPLDLRRRRQAAAGHARRGARRAGRRDRRANLPLLGPRRRRPDGARDALRRSRDDDARDELAVASRTRSGCAWSPTCRSARSSRAASIRRPSSR